jgi:CDP-diacylglycerol--serine O-phosphatidyltransferase
VKKGIYLLPNGITLCGMFAGFFAIVSALQGDFVLASWAVVVAGVFDALDGAVARLTHSTTKFGIELDSLSDVIAFGVAPAVLVYTWALMPFGRVGWAVAFLFTACGAMRLARFNIQKDSTEKKYFTGMPIPAAAGVIVSTILFYGHMGWGATRSVYILVLTVILSFLMVSTLRFHSLKELEITKRKPFRLLVSFVVIIAVIVMHPEIALFAVGMLYLWGGLAENAFLLIVKWKQKEEAP